MHLGPITSLYTLIKPLDLLVSKTQALQQQNSSSSSMSKREKGKKNLIFKNETPNQTPLLPHSLKGLLCSKNLKQLTP